MPFSLSSSPSFGANHTPLMKAVLANDLESIKTLIDDGEDWAAVSSNNSTALHIAVAKNHVACVKALLSAIAKKESSSKFNPDGEQTSAVRQAASCWSDTLQTPLHLAAKYGYCETLSVLLDTGVGYLCSTKNDLEPPIYSALANHHIDAAQMIAAKCDIFIVADANGDFPVHIAAKMRNSELLADLATPQGVSSCNGEGNTALHIAANERSAIVTESVKVLIKHGSDVNARNDEGYTPMHIATERNNAKLMQYLLELGADAEARTINGDTALHLAIDAGMEAASTLLAKKVCVNVENCLGRTPLHCAVTKGNYFTAKGNPALVEGLIQLGANISAADKVGDTPLHIAIQSDRTQMALLLLAGGAKPNARGKHRRTPLHVAVYLSNQELIQALLQAGADPSARDAWGETPLHSSLHRGTIRTSLTLIEKGSSSVAKGKLGITPVHLAVAMKLEPILQAFVAADADLSMPDDSHSTPLHLALGYREESFSLILAASGRSGVTSLDVKGLSPLDIAIRNGHYNTARSLVENGADISSGRDTTSPIFLLDNRQLVEADTALFQVLVDNGADLDSLDRAGRTSLQRWTDELRNFPNHHPTFYCAKMYDAHAIEVPVWGSRRQASRRR